MESFLALFCGRFGWLDGPIWGEKWDPDDTKRTPKRWLVER